MNEDQNIRGMVEFIERDAHEKARELEDEAKAQYNSEKANFVEAEKKKVLTQYEKSKNQVEVDRRVIAAGHSQKERMRVLDTRRDLLNTLRDRIKQKMLDIVSEERKYAPLLQLLLNQSSVSVRADSLIYVRQRDANLIKGMLGNAEAEVLKVTGQKVKLTLDTSKYLDDSVIGGLTILGFNKKITCENTLANRAHHVFEEQLPTVRYMMFHEKASLQ